jgi:hypothetical protein
MKIYRIDGNRIWRYASHGLIYFDSKEKCEKYLTEKGFFLHKEGIDKGFWFTTKDPKGFSGKTEYRKIVEISVN